jgi:hypothetical protein
VDWLIDLLSGAAGAALVAGIFGVIQKRSTLKDAHGKALRYLMLYVIQERAKQHIKDNSITLEERRSLHHWHALYHNQLGGNGDADDLMAQVDALPLDIDD